LEVKQLLDLDIPYFSVEFDDCCVTSKHGFACGCSVPPRQFSIDRLSSLRNEYVSVQRRLLTYSISAPSQERRDTLRSGKIVRHEKALNYDDSFGAVIDINLQLISQLLKQSGIEEESDNLSWIGIDWHDNTSSCSFAPVEMDFYSGATGIYYFLDLLAFINGEKGDYRGVVNTRTRALFDEVSSTLRANAEHSMHGALRGSASLTYYLLKLSEITSEGQFLSLAQSFTEDHYNPLIDNLENDDLLNGVSGLAILAARVYKKRPSEKLRASLEAILQILRERASVSAATLGVGGKGLRLVV
jgi:lantibiotic modifying enzyme